jgi:uncharacterized protein (TIGR03435 family)
MRHELKPDLKRGMLLAACVLVGLTAPASRAQSDNIQRPAFEVASIKRAAPGVSGGGISIGQGGRLTTANVNLKQIIRVAYHVQAFQIVGGPEWIESDTYDIDAEPEAAVAPERRTDPNTNPVLRMIQSLLADRFQLKLHLETREVPLFSLVVGKNGSKLVEAANANGNDSVRSGRGRMAATGINMLSLIQFLGQELGRPVQDKTGLHGK